MEIDKISNYTQLRSFRVDDLKHLPFLSITNHRAFDCLGQAETQRKHETDFVYTLDYEFLKMAGK